MQVWCYKNWYLISEKTDKGSGSTYSKCILTILFLNRFLRCDHLLESSRRDDSNEWLQHRIILRLKGISQKTLNVSRYRHLLFISHKFVKGFLTIRFFLLFLSSWNFHGVCQRFSYNQERNSSWIRQKMSNFPLYPHYKNCPLL